MKSIKHKLWLAIFGMTALVIVAIWICQVVLLEQTYMAEKKTEIMDSTKTVVSIINDKGVLLAAADLKEIAADNNYCIEVTEYLNGAPSQRMTMQPVGSRNILDTNEGVRLGMLQLLEQSSQEYVFSDNLQAAHEPRYYVGASYQNSSQSEYIVMVASELAPVQEAVSTIRMQLIWITAVLLLVATISSFVIARSLTKPILQVSAAAQEIAKGNLNTYVDIRSKDELGRLGNDFNAMSKEISKANSLQRELIANVSHDIRTPLTMIKGYAETIKDLTGDIKEKRDAQLDIIIDESNRLNGLVNDILDLSKLQAGQITPEYSQFDLAAKLRDIIHRYDLLTTNEGYQFTLTAPAKVMVYADELKIEQVIYNLVNNATNHTGPDKKVFVVLEDEPNRAVVKVIDTGVGIEKKYLPLIWDRYYKPYKKKDRKGMGTGLGLSIVKGILQMHHFNFGVTSTKGQGSTFWFEVKKGEADNSSL